MNGFESQSNELSSSFAPAGDGTGARSYAHPQAEEVLNGAVEMLGKTEEGAYMLAVMREYRIPVTVLKGPKVTFNNPDEFHVYLVAPEKFKPELPILAMTLYCGIRDAEQAHNGFRRPNKDEVEASEYATIVFSKAFDIVLHMFKIADELNAKLGFKKVLDMVVALGYGDLYKAYKAGSDFYALQALYLKKEYQAIEGAGGG